MKSVITFMLLLTQVCFAKGGDNTSAIFADYIVPTSVDLVPYSRFQVQIVKPYKGTSSTEISYIFPRELTGDPALTVNLKLVSMDLTQRLSHWDSPQMTAVCTDDTQRINCNIYVKKTPVLKSRNFIQSFSIAPSFSAEVSANNFVTAIDKKNVTDFLNKSGSPQDVIQKQIEVLDQFLISEPGGILSYEF